MRIRELSRIIACRGLSAWPGIGTPGGTEQTHLRVPSRIRAKYFVRSTLLVRIHKNGVKQVGVSGGSAGLDLAVKVIVDGKHELLNQNKMTIPEPCLLYGGRYQKNWLTA